MRCVEADEIHVFDCTRGRSEQHREGNIGTVRNTVHSFRADGQYDGEELACMAPASEHNGIMNDFVVGWTELERMKVESVEAFKSETWRLSYVSGASAKK